MFVRFITSKLLRVIVCAAAGLYGLYNAISCFVTLYKAGHQPYLMAGAVRFDFQGYYMMAAMHVGICLLLGVALPQGNEKAAGKDRSPVNLQISCNVFPLCALLG
jgi:hypothetical protein